MNEINITTTPSTHAPSGITWMENDTLPFTPTPPMSMTGEQGREGDMGAGMTKGVEERAEEGKDEKIEEDDNEEEVAPKDFERGPWMDPGNTPYGRGK